MLINGNYPFPTNGLSKNFKFSVHTYLCEELVIVHRRVHELTVLEEVVGLHLSFTLQVEVGRVGFGRCGLDLVSALRALFMLGWFSA